MQAVHRKRTLHNALNSNINITPLIDVLLVLIVIFMVITPVTPKGFDTNIPSPPQSNVLKEPSTALVLSIDGNGGIRLNQENLDLASLSPRLQDVFRMRADHTIFVQADNEIEFDRVAQLIDVARGAGADRIGLMTTEVTAH